MSHYNFINLMILSPWLVWNSFLFYYAAIYDKTFNFFIANRKQLIKCFSLLGIIILLSVYLFLFRLLGNTRNLNVYELFETLGNYFNLLTISDIIFLSLFFMFLVIFGVLALGWIYISIRRRILALYLYVSQFYLFSDFFNWLCISSVNSHFYLAGRINIFTNNLTIYAMALYIWPLGPRMIRKTLFRFILPYLIIFDMLTNNGTITKFFIILPWYYVYSVFKACFMLYKKIHKPENIDISIRMYGNGTRYDTALKRNKAFQAQQK